MNAYEEKRAARIERLRAKASRLAAQGEATIAAAQKRAEVIPFGQPVLVGHHSQKRDENYRARIRGGFVRGFAQLDEANDAARRADAAERNDAVSSDDPDAVTKLAAKAERFEAWLAKAREVNKVVLRATRAATRDGVTGDALEARIATALVAFGLKDDEARELAKPNVFGDRGVPSYRIKNKSAEVRRLRERIAKLTAAAAELPRGAVEIGDVVVEDVDNRVRVRFPDKPAAEVRTKLRAHGFLWARSEGAWQARSSEQAWRAALAIVRALTPETAPPDEPAPEPERERCRCEDGGTCDVSHDPATCPCERCSAPAASSRRGPVCPRCLDIEPGTPGGTPDAPDPGPYTDTLCKACEVATQPPPELPRARHAPPAQPPTKPTHAAQHWVF